MPPTERGFSLDTFNQRQNNRFYLSRGELLQEICFNNVNAGKKTALNTGVMQAVSHIADKTCLESILTLMNGPMAAKRERDFAFGVQNACQSAVQAEDW
ncbi:MAG: hypothetical protein MZV70_73975 [Desulfobacterales bacterium]|nr:hypothetical protein [Desulfobacterales bacterium]